jgi:integrase/recombinase XerD
MPSTQQEMVRILASLDDYAARTSANGRSNARRLRGLLLLLRYSGMRIRDAVSLGTDRLNGNRIFLYTQKTNEPVHSVLPDFPTKTLEATPKTSERFFFWSGTGKIESVVRSWQTRLRSLFKLAGIQNGHAHRLRDTFAVELLLAGVPIDRVAVLLGHRNSKITERHYNPRVRSRQEQLESDVRRAWSRDTWVLMENENQTSGTPQVHGKTNAVN